MFWQSSDGSLVNPGEAVKNFERVIWLRYAGAMKEREEALLGLRRMPGGPWGSPWWEYEGALGELWGSAWGNSVAALRGFCGIQGAFEIVGPAVRSTSEWGDGFTCYLKRIMQFNQPKQHPHSEIFSRSSEGAVRNSGWSFEGFGVCSDGALEESWRNIQGFRSEPWMGSELGGSSGVALGEFWSRSERAEFWMVWVRWLI